MQKDIYAQIAALYFQLGEKFTELAATEPTTDPTPDPPTIPPSNPPPDRRLGRWINAMQLDIVPIAARPDAARHVNVQRRYTLIELFTTRSGSWELSDLFGSVDAWARTAYLKSPSAPDYFEEGGSDHSLFARVIDKNGRALIDQRFVYWSDGINRLSDPTYAKYVYRTAKARSGWAGQEIYNFYAPARNESGAWCWCPAGAADVVVGGGLPNGDHISTFAVWQMQE